MQSEEGYKCSWSQTINVQVEEPKSIKMPVEKFFILSCCDMKNLETLIVLDGEIKLGIVACSDIRGTKKMIKSDGFCVCVFINNRADKWHHRFGITFSF